MSSLTVTGTSSNTSLVASTGIVFGSSGANRTVTITPVSGQTGTTTITLTVTDGGGHDGDVDVRGDGRTHRRTRLRRFRRWLTRQ